MESTTREKRIRWIWGICLVLMWSCALLLFIKTNGKLSIEELLRYKPENPWLAALAMLGLYLLKSVDSLMHTAGLQVEVLSTKAVWFGVTYKEDKEYVAGELRKLHENGSYPPAL